MILESVKLTALTITHVHDRESGIIFRIMSKETISSFLCLFLSKSMRPNIFLGVSEGSAQYKKWYYELMVDHTEPFVTAEATHLRVGWASTEGYSPYPGGGEEWGGNGVGDDLFSYGFDGLHLWSGRHCPFSLDSFQMEVL